MTNTHVVYKFVRLGTPVVVYVGSGLPGRPKASLRNSHVDGIRDLRNKLKVLVSKPMPEEYARQLEARLIQKYEPEFNTIIPKIRSPKLVSVSKSALILDLSPSEFSALKQAYESLCPCSLVSEGRYLVYGGDDESTINDESTGVPSFKFKIKDVNCTKPIRFAVSRASKAYDYHTLGILL